MNSKNNYSFKSKTGCTGRSIMPGSYFGMMEMMSKYCLARKIKPDKKAVRQSAMDQCWGMLSVETVFKQ